MHYLVNISENIEYAQRIADDRTKGWPMVDSLWKVVAAIIAYNWIVRKMVDFMRDRKPYNLKGVIFIYNISVLLLNSYIFVETVFCMIKLNYNLLCNENTKNNRDPMEMRFASVSWVFYMAKYVELFDTLFIVLRKKEQNLSFLHMYHHSSIIFFSWIHAKWFPTGNSYLVKLLNSGVHVIMYLYYGLSSLGPKVAKYLWWKKYLTLLQLVQFMSGVFFGLIGIATNCTFFPGWYNALEIIYLFTFLFLFSKFYINAYNKRGSVEKTFKKVICFKKDDKDEKIL